MIRKNIVQVGSHGSFSVMLPVTEEGGSITIGSGPFWIAGKEYELQEDESFLHDPKVVRTDAYLVMDAGMVRVVVDRMKAGMVPLAARERFTVLHKVLSILETSPGSFTMYVTNISPGD